MHVFRKSFFKTEGISIELALVLSHASADGKDLLRSWLDEVKRHDNLEKRTRRLLETDIKPLLNSLNYRGFAEKLLNWVEACQVDSQPNEKAFNEFEQEREVWKILLAEITINPAMK